MYKKNHILVLKFGSSVLRSENDLSRVVHEIYRWWRKGAQVVVVASAFGETTNEILGRAKGVCVNPDPATLAPLLATGEAASSALLALALNRAGITARVLNAYEAGLRTIGDPLDAELVGFDSTRIRTELETAVVVLPGFVGRGENGNTTVLGRGGSDLSAVFIAQRLNAHCVLIKDVDGIYASDPAMATTRPYRFDELKYETASLLSGNLLQAKAIRFAAEHQIPFVVTSIGTANQTTVGGKRDRLSGSQTVFEPTRVALLGCGTVGGGVFHALRSLPELFTVTGIGTRNRNKALECGVPEEIVTDDLYALIEQPNDIVVELIGGTTDAPVLINRALSLGRDVVTANKALLARDSGSLNAVALKHSAKLRFSAAVGGSMPALEAVEHVCKRQRIRSLRGVLNGTTTFVLDRLAEGKDLASAVRAAVQCGYAEADYDLDLSGADAAHKLIVLVKEAFDVFLHYDDIERIGIDGLSASSVRVAKAQNRIVRSVATCEPTGKHLKASVKPLALAERDPLARTFGVENCLIIETDNGNLVVRGQGAGRWPTTEAIIADLMDLRRESHLAAAINETAQKEVCA